MMLTAVFRIFPFCLLVLVALCFAPGALQAQIPNLQLPNPFQLTPNQQGNPGQPLTPNFQTYQPVNPDQRQLAPSSRLESLYSNRAGRLLSQFGYDILGVPTSVTTSQFGASQDNYILDQGDELVVVLRGQEDGTYREQVNRDGQIILPRLNPIPASGRTLGEFRADLERQVAQTYISTNVFVSLGNIKQISVFVTGEVRAPGVRYLSALASPLDALLISGGIAKTGSLRTVTLIRGNQTQTIDLYGFLTQVNPGPLLPLRNGDRIYVPPLQNTVAIGGLVRRPAIYEMRNGEALSTNDLIGLAGGVEIPGAYRLSKMELEPDGSTRLVNLPQGETIRNGEILFVDSNVDVALDRVRLSGAVRLPGAYPRANIPSVKRLLNGVEDLTPQSYTPFAIVARRDPKLNARVLLPFSLTRVLAGSEDVNLQNDDFVYVFTRSEMHALAEAAAAATAPPAPMVPGECQDTRPAGPGSFSGQPNSQVPDSLSAPCPAVNGSGASNAPSAPSAANAPANNPVPAANGPVGFYGPSYYPGTSPLNPQFTPPLSYYPGYPGGAGALGNSVPQAQFSRQVQILDPDPLNPIEASQQQTQQGTGPSGASAQENDATDVLTSLTMSTDARRAVRDAARTVGVTTEILVRMASDHLVWVLDQVQDPGAYLAAGGTTLEDIVQIAGGPLDRADLSFVEVTSTNFEPLAGSSRTVRTGYKGTPDDFRRVSLRALDVVRLRPVFSDRDQGQVSVAGQVRFPGTLDITRAERLSSLLERAGGLTDEAYPFGAIFTRRRAAVAEREANLRAARELESQATTPSPLTLSADAGVGQAAQFASTLAGQLRTAPVLGRIAVTADPAILRVRPELDVLLEPGDTLYIPKRPSIVTVSGEVLNNGTFQYESGLSVRDYLERAGGTTQGADEGRTFILLPDGTARTVAENWLSFNTAAVIPPGSTIIVPRDLQPFSLGPFVRDITQIVSQLAITAASLVVINR
jgi:protein involved in polysaccharide export with SLBB domain